jgi:hypothetical protein
MNCCGDFQKRDPLVQVVEQAGLRFPHSLSRVRNFKERCNLWNGG